MNDKGRDILWLGARLLAGGLLSVAGYLKAVRPPAEFALVLSRYMIFPVKFLFPLATVIPWIEVLAGLALMVGLFTRQAATLAAMLYAVFVGVLAQSLIRQLPIESCGCFGNIGPTLTLPQTMGMDGVLLLLCLILALRDRFPFSLDEFFSSHEKTTPH